MKIETILNVLVMADRRRISPPPFTFPRAERQYRAFRDRIIRMNKDKDEEIEYLVEYGNR